MFDGQNVFDDAPSYSGGWHAHGAINRLAKQVARPVVIGIDHGGHHRLSELSPFQVAHHAGELEGFLHWIVSWLLPKLRDEHHLTHDPRRTIVAGSSMGGLAALYATLRYPDVFGGAIVMSPSLWVSHGAIFDWVARHGIPARRRIYLDAGAREGKGKMLANARRMGGLLNASGHVELFFRADPKGRHHEKAWRRRLLPALRFHFGDLKAKRGPAVVPRRARLLPPPRVSSRAEAPHDAIYETPVAGGGGASL
jgi:predicted alpha/beta superfamily hydrolase